MKELGNEHKQEVGRWANNRVENSHLSFRRRERAMLRFRRMKSLQKFASVHANVHNGSVRPNAPIVRRGRVGVLHASSPQARQPVPLFQLIA
jgi:transposase-like protein